MEQDKIDGKDSTDKKKAEKDAKKLPKETLIRLEGMGFSESEKEGQSRLYVKKTDDFTFFWDFRKSEQGRPYASRKDPEGGYDDIPQDELEQMEEYINFRPDQKKKKEKTESKKEDAVPAVIDGKTGKPIMIDDDGEAYTIMNIKDDNQVLAEIMGGYLDEFAYQFETSTKKKITGLSWAGVKEVARKQGNISVEDIKITDTDKTYRVLAKAKDIARNVSIFGVAEQSKMMTLKTKAEVEDIHALSKCVSRAQRNAIRALIPEMIIKNVIQEFLKKAQPKS